jgi:hypothetical protein
MVRKTRTKKDNKRKRKKKYETPVLIYHGSIAKFTRTPF